MDVNLPVTDASEVSVDDLLNIPEIYEILASDIVNESVEEGHSTVGRPSGGIKPDEKRQNQDEMQQKGTRQVSQSTLDSCVDAAFEEVSKEETKSSLRSSTVALPTGQLVHILNDDEMNSLRRRLSTQVVSLSHERRKKEETLQKKKQIQELKAELARLNNLEAQLKEYERRPLESLQEELQLRQEEIADLAKKLENAAQEEQALVNLFGDSLLH